MCSVPCAVCTLRTVHCEGFVCNVTAPWCYVGSSRYGKWWCTVCWRGGGQKKFLFRNNFCTFLVSLMVENGDPMSAHTFSTFWVVFMAKKCHFLAKNAISGHEQPWRPQMAGSRWIKVGSRLVTPGLMCWNLFSLLTLPSGGSRRAQNSPIMP